MSAFSSINIARTGVGFSHFWIDTIADNIANLNTVSSGDQEPFRARMLLAQSLVGGGVAVGGTRLAEDEVTRISDPGNPLADADGNVALPVVDISTEMSNLMIANRTYQANLRVIESSREAYASALRLGGQR